MSAPFDLAEAYRRAGWTGTVPLPPAQKAPVPAGFTGGTGRWPKPEDLEQWRREGYKTRVGDGLVHHDAHNLALRLPPTVVGLDVDCYDGKTGGDTLAALEEKLGQLPPTVMTTSRADGSGIRLYRVPTGLEWPTEAGPCIEIIRHGHRYAVAPPSVNPSTGKEYRWLRSDGTQAEAPAPGELPELPGPWVAYLTGTALNGDANGARPGTRASQREAHKPGREWLRTLPGGLPCRYVGKLAADAYASARREDGSAYDHTMRDVLALLRAGERGHPGVPDVLTRTRETYVATVAAERPRAIAEGEFDRFTVGGAVKVLGGPSPEAGRGCDCIEDHLTILDAGTPTPPAEESADDEQPNRYQQLRAALLDDDGLRNIPPPTPLVADTIYRDSLNWLQGKPGHGKSFAAIDIACSVASGQDWHERPVAQGVVLYLIAEGASGLGPRVDAWKAAHGVAHLESALFLPVAVQFLNDVDLAALRRLVHELQPVLVVIDTQARVTVGAEENSSRDMGVFVEAADVIRRASGACVLVVHHEGRAGEHMRGSTALEGAATTVLRASKDGPMVYLSCKKQKDEEEFPEIPLRLFRLGESAILSHEGLGLGHVVTESETQLIETLRDHFGTEGASTTRLLEASGVAKTSFYRALKVLVTRDVVRNVSLTKRPVYILTADLQQQEVPDGSK